MTQHAVNTAAIFKGADGHHYRVASIRTGVDTFGAMRGAENTDVFLASVVKATGEDFRNGTGFWVGLDTIREHAESAGAAWPMFWITLADCRAIVAFVDAYLATMADSAPAAPAYIGIQPDAPVSVVAAPTCDHRTDCACSYWQAIEAGVPIGDEGEPCDRS